MLCENSLPFYTNLSMGCCVQIMFPFLNTIRTTSLLFKLAWTSSGLGAVLLEEIPFARFWSNSWLCTWVVFDYTTCSFFKLLVLTFQPTSFALLSTGAVSRIGWDGFVGFRGSPSLKFSGSTSAEFFIVLMRNLPVLLVHNLSILLVQNLPILLGWFQGHVKPSHNLKIGIMLFCSCYPFEISYLLLVYMFWLGRGVTF